jgi:hypothetical protein
MLLLMLLDATMCVFHFKGLISLSYPALWQEQAEVH